MTSTEHYRHEFKYPVSSAQIALLENRIRPFMSPDPHAGPDGVYSIRSLYFDDWENSCYYENENGTEPERSSGFGFTIIPQHISHLNVSEKSMG